MKTIINTLRDNRSPIAQVAKPISIIGAIAATMVLETMSIYIVHALSAF